MRFPCSRTLSAAAGVLLLALALLGAMGQIAHADPKAEIKAKVKEAMENYDMMSYDDAKKQLTQALATAKRNKLDNEVLTARVHVFLGIVYFSGLQDQDAAKLEFLTAVQIDPKIQLDAAYKTPEMSRLLEQARSEVAGGGNSSGGGEVDTGPPVNCGAIKGMVHNVLDGGPAGAGLPIYAALGPDVNGRAAHVSVQFRSEGATTYTESKLDRQGCKYFGEIPGAAMKGSVVHYYVAAYDASGKVIASKGSAGSPNLLEISAGKGGTGKAGKPGDDDDPLTKHPTPTVTTASSDGGKDDGTNAIVKVAPGPHKTSKVVLGIVAGTSAGYVTGATEGGNNVRDCCVGTSLLVLTPELGINLSAKTELSFAVRLGFPIGADVTGHATLAPAALVRIRYFLGGGNEGFRVMGQLGGGIMRNTIKLSNAMPGMETDIVAQGPLLLGGGIGYSKMLGSTVSFVVDFSALAGIPVTKKIGTSTLNFGLTGDISLGLQFGF